MACTEPHLALAVFEEKAGHCLWQAKHAEIKLAVLRKHFILGQIY
jgi:hypothetical protein